MTAVVNKSHTRMWRIRMPWGEHPLTAGRFIPKQLGTTPGIEKWNPREPPDPSRGQEINATGFGPDQSSPPRSVAAISSFKSHWSRFLRNKVKVNQHARDLFARTLSKNYCKNI